MKKLIISTLILFSVQAFSQVIIGDGAGTATNKTSVLLEFANSNNKGIVLPYVKTVPAASATNQGAILLDVSTATAARIKYSNGTSWIDLSGRDGDVTAALADQPTTAEDTAAKMVIGTVTSSTPDGVLVLESTTKAMVLPIVTDVNNIPSPSPGMMVYVNKADAKRLAVYNGSIWAFWAPES
ncbi:hypothetical protein PFY12_06940 [Chryseobacterium camelliae]|uniref:Uncharacterized protein n=1 Tax=Chryseobacterium camelliae TaxID=1265445 RepID=A0ABY7QSP9_9FLAO|nr:hypothetical protein [Chryseobacterium camelliae]WBV61853.1 hypothetical protein PFY12_06940 [Chryseobacterium camelliae]